MLASELSVIGIILLGVVALALFKTVVVVQQQQAVIVERLGRYRGTLDAGIHLLIPFVDVIRYTLTLKEEALDIPEQTCITRDNVQVGIDGILYYRIMDPSRAAYGITDFRFAVSQLAQTALRSELGKIDLDKSFEERSTINHAIIVELDKASEPWGVKVLRYEIKNINPPREVLAAMEKQMRAEREKRAVILASEGERDARINAAEGAKRGEVLASEGQAQAQQNFAEVKKRTAILASEGEAAARINDAEGRARAIQILAEASAQSLVRVAEATLEPGGQAAIQLRLAEKYIQQFGKLAQKGTSLIVPADAANAVAMIKMAVAAGTNTTGDKR